MPIHIGEMTSDITVVDGDIPLSREQIERIAELVMQRMSEQKRMQQHHEQTTAIRRHAAPRSGIQD